MHTKNSFVKYALSICLIILMTFNFTAESFAASTTAVFYSELVENNIANTDDVVDVTESGLVYEDVESEVIIDETAEEVAEESDIVDEIDDVIEESEVIDEIDETIEESEAVDEMEEIIDESEVVDEMEDAIEELEVIEEVEDAANEEAIEEPGATIVGEYAWSDTEGFLQVNKNKVGTNKGIQTKVYNVVSVWGINCSFTIENKRLSKNVSSSVATATNSENGIVVKGGNTRGRLDIKASDGTKYIIYNYSCMEECQYLYNMFHDKVVAVLGDSISTLQYNIPDGNDDWNYVDRPDRTKFTYDSVYWRDIIIRFGAIQGTIDAWAGSSIGTGYYGMCNTWRIKKLDDKGIPDIIFFYGGSNADSKQEEFNKNADYAKIVVSENVVSSTQKAYPMTLNKLRYYYPDTTIVQIIPYYNPSIKSEKAIREIAAYYNIATVDLRVLRKREVIAKNNELHPSPTGHKQIANFICEQLYQKQDQVEYETSEANRMITFNAEKNGGECAVVSMYGRDPEIKNVKATKVGYIFKGWYTKSSGGTLVTNFKKIGFSQTVYAQFEKCKSTKYVVENAKSPTFVSSGYTGDVYCTVCRKLIMKGSKYNLEVTGCEGTSISKDVLPVGWKWENPEENKEFGEAGTISEFKVLYDGAESDINSEELSATIDFKAEPHEYSEYSEYGAYAHKCSKCGSIHKYPINVCPICNEEDCQSSDINGTHLFTDEGVCTRCDYRCNHMINLEESAEEMTWAIDVETEECILCHAKVAVPKDADNNPIIGGIPDQLWVTGVADQSFTGSAIRQPNMSVYWGYKLLVRNTDYTVKYVNNTNAGKATVVITGKGNYKGTIKKTFVIAPLSLESAKAFDEDITLAVTGKKQKPTTKFTLKVDNKTVTLKEGVDYKYEYPSIVEAGTYTVTIRGFGNYCGAKTINVNVVDDAIPVTALTISKISNQVYTGKEVEPALKVLYKKKPLSEGDDYTVSYSNNTEIGTAIATITGAGSYIGTRNIAFKIVGIPISTASVVIKDAPIVYTGEEIELNSVRVYMKSTGEDLVEGKDYTVLSYSNNLNAGTGTITFAGINGYSGTLKKKFIINKVPITDDRITIETSSSVKYQKNGAKPTVIVRDGTKVLSKGVDYSVKYYYNDLPSLKRPRVVVTGKGNYTGTSKNIYFDIEKRSISDDDIKITATDIVAHKKAGICKPTIKLKDRNGATLKSGVDYSKTVEYTYKYFTKGVKWKVNNNKSYISIDYVAGSKVNMSKDIIPAGTVIEAKITGKGAYCDTKTVTFRYVGNNISNAKISIINQNQSYADKAIILDKEDFKAKIKINGVYEPLTLGEDFKIVEYKNNVNAGTAKVTIAGIGNYGGTKTVSFKIVSKSMNYKIKFDKNDPLATGKMSSVTIPTGTKLTANAYKLSGKKFKCWCTKPSIDEPFAQTYVNEEKFTKKGFSILSFGDNVTLYAIWE